MLAHSQFNPLSHSDRQLSHHQTVHRNYHHFSLYFTIQTFFFETKLNKAFGSPN